VGKTIVIYITFPPDVVRQKLLKSANASRSYSKNNSGTDFLRHGVYSTLGAFYNYVLYTLTF